MKLLFAALIGYLIGGINPAYIIAKMRGFDIRKHGSGNAGASNAVIIMGKKAGVFSALFDIAKAFFSVAFAEKLFVAEIAAGSVAGAACIVGHIFPLFMGFRGGKGLACLGGVILAFDPLVFLVILSVELILVLVVDYICIVPITASVVFPILYYSMTRDLIGTLSLLAVTVIILYKHVENLKRIKSGTEAHFSFLWKRNKEIERLNVETYDPAEEERKQKQTEEK